MFPDADPQFIRSALGKDATLDDVQRMAESMSKGAYPKANEASDADTVASESTANSHAPPKKKKSVRKKIGKAPPVSPTNTNAGTLASTSG